MLLLGVLLLACQGAWSQNGVFTAQQTVGVGSAAQSVTVTAQAAGTVAKVEVLTVGAPGLDFTGIPGATPCAGALAVGQTCTESVTFTPASPGLRRGAVVVLDSDHNILGMTYLSGTGLGGLGVLASGNILPVAGNGAYKNAVVDNIPATGSELYLPSSVVLDGAGNMYIADTLHNRVRMVCASVSSPTINGTSCPAAGYITTIAGIAGVPAYGGDTEPASNSSVNLDQPSGLALDGAGNLYIADTANNVVRKITAATGVITTVAGNGTAGYEGDGLLAISSQTELNAPQGVTLDASGNLYIADTANSVIRMVAAATGVVTTVAGNGTAGYGGDGLSAKSAQTELNSPDAVAFDLNGNMYIADSLNNRVRVVNSTTGMITTFAGTGGQGYTGDGAAASAAELNAPSGVVVDAAGNVYIADTQNQAIRKVSSALNATPGVISTIADAGIGEYYQGGAFYPINLHGPVGLFLDGSANLYFADSVNMVIREMQSNYAALDYTAKPIRQGSPSAAQNQIVQNAGNAPLVLTTPDVQVDPKGAQGLQNAVLGSNTTCPTDSNPFLTVNEPACVISAIFEPNVGLQFAQGVASEPLDANIYIGTAGDTVNAPLDIELVGIATPLNSTTLSLTSSQNPSNFGQNVTFTATVSTGTGNLTGTVTFFDGATILKSGVALAQGVATFTTSTLAVGQHAITATYSGDSLHFASPAGALSPNPLQTVNEATATSLQVSQTQTGGLPNLTFTATVTAPGGGGVTVGALAGYSPTVAFTTGGNTLCTSPVLLVGAAYQAVCSTSALPQGSSAVLATYSGDQTAFVLGSSATLSQDVQVPSTITLVPNPSPSTYGMPVTFTVTVAPTATINGAAAATGVISILETGQANPIGTITLAGNPGTGTFTTSSLPAGKNQITANFPGDTDYSSGTASLTQPVNQAQTGTTLAAVPNTGIAGLSVAITATVKVTQGAATTTGTVTFTDTLNGVTTNLGSATVGAGGAATINPLLAPGAHSIAATYGGDANCLGSSGTLPLTVVQATTQTVVAANPNPAMVEQAATFTATVTGNGGAPTGTVTFSANGNAIGVGNVGANGIATITNATLAAGTYTITAAYGGDTNDAASSGTGSLVVGTIPTVADLGQSATTGTNPQVILVATILNNVSSATPLATPTGTVTFSSGANVVGSAPLDSSGVATLVPNLPTGTYQIVASYSGDPMHTPSASSAVTFSTTALGFNLAVNPPSVTMTASQNATVNVTLTSSAGFVDTIGLGCASLPAGVTCHFSSDSVNLPANGTEKITLTIDGNNPLGGGSTAMNAQRGGRGFSLAGLFLPLSVLFGCIFWRLRKRYAAVMTAAVVLLLGSAALLVSGCSGFSQSSAAPGTYVIQVTGVGADSDITHYQNVSLTITK